MINLQILLLIIFPIGCLVRVIWCGSVVYLKYKWLSFVEGTIDENSYSLSSNVFSAGLGVSRYALIFQFDWQAKRCNRLKKRELIPKKVQRLFIISNYLWLVASIVFFGPMFLI
jgi:hypothetical protein